MTEKLFWKDAYMKEFDATVTKVEGNVIQLDRTAFYPTSGGQPNDTGKLFAKGTEYKVIDVKKQGDEEILHVFEIPVTDLKVGDSVKGLIDWDKRYAHMKLHTAIHLLDAVVEKNFSSGMLTGGQIYDERARVDVDMADLTREKAQEIIEKCNSVANEGHEVTSKTITQEEALSNPRLVRTEPGRELIKRLQVVRVVEIVGLDEQTDGGTHVKNTKEIGAIKLSDYVNKGKRNKRVEIVLGK